LYLHNGIFNTAVVCRRYDNHRQRLSWCQSFIGL